MHLTVLVLNVTITAATAAGGFRAIDGNKDTPRWPTPSHHRHSR